MLSPLKRIAGAAAFGVGGGGTAWWGFHDIAIFVQALRDDKPIVETQSAMSGLPLIGLALVAIGALFLLPAASTLRFRFIQEKLAIGILISLVIGAMLSLGGSLVIDTVMDAYEYQKCAVKHGRRMTFVTWAGQGRTCLPTQVDS